MTTCPFARSGFPTQSLFWSPGITQADTSKLTPLWDCVTLNTATFPEATDVPLGKFTRIESPSLIVTRSAMSSRRACDMTDTSAPLSRMKRIFFRPTNHLYGEGFSSSVSFPVVGGVACLPFWEIPEKVFFFLVVLGFFGGGEVENPSSTSPSENPPASCVKLRPLQHPWHPHSW